MKVLIIEDEKVLSDTIAQCICKDFQTEQAFDGYEGYLYAKENIYDAIILDLMLPEMSGYDVLLKLRENKIYTPVLILTAKDSISDKLKGFRYGADYYLVKPFEVEELIARLNAIIRRTKGNYQDELLEFKDIEEKDDESNDNLRIDEIDLSTDEEVLPETSKPFDEEEDDFDDEDEEPSLDDLEFPDDIDDMEGEGEE